MPSSSITIQPIPLVPFQPDWIFWVLLCIFLLLASVQAGYAPHLRMMVKAVFSFRQAGYFIREGSPLRHGLFAGVGLLYVLTMAMFVLSALQLVFDRSAFPVSTFRIYLLLVLAITGFWAFKVLIMNTLSVVFKTGAINTEYKINLLCFLAVLSIVLLPFLVFAVYLKAVWSVYVAFGMILFFSLARFFRVFLIGLSLTRFSYFFLFIYLCTLEILPLLLAAKLILSYF